MVFSVLKKYCPYTSKTGKAYKSSYKKKREIISRKIRKCNTKISNLNIFYQKSKIAKLNAKIEKLRQEQKDSFFTEKNAEEKVAISKIITDSKYFFKYANRHRKALSSPSILVDSNSDLFTDPKAIADRLQDHFSSVFSVPDKNLNPLTNLNSPPISVPLPKFCVTTNDIEKAINEIKSQSACPQSNIPALVLKNCKLTLSLALTLFLNKSFQLGIVPRSFKVQQIIPIYKKGLKTDPRNHRPIALTPHPIKIYERVIRDKLVEFLETNNIFNRNQHGFRKNRSCLSQLISHTTYILDNLISNKEVDTIYIDYSKAFDKIHHSIILQKLKFYNITKEYLVWIESFLTDRHQFVLINGSKSYKVGVTSGVPQGSVLGPLLFILFINDLTNNITNSNIYTFADDTKLVHPIQYSSDTISLQSDLNSIITWSKNNNMKLNKDKFELITHIPPNKVQLHNLFKELPFNTEHTTYSTGMDTIFSSNVVRDLGILIDSKLNWVDHINSVCKKGRQLSGWILNVFYSRDKRVMLTLFNSLVRSRMEYCSQIWDPYSINEVSALEQI